MQQVTLRIKRYNPEQDIMPVFREYQVDGTKPDDLAKGKKTGFTFTLTG